MRMNEIIFIYIICIIGDDGNGKIDQGQGWDT